jgi:hypothetical protein
MAYSKITDDMNIIQALPDEPNDVGGLTAAQLKAKFDEAGNKLKTGINRLVDELNESESGVAASGVSFTRSAGVPAENVQDAIENVQSQISGISQGAVADGSITTAKLDDKAATTAKIDDLAVTSDKLANGAVTEDKILDGSVTLEKLSSDARSPIITVGWEDVSDDVDISYVYYPVSQLSKTFKFSSALGLMYFSITCNISLSAGTSLVRLTQSGYLGSISRDVAIPVSRIGYAASYDGEQFTIFIGDNAVNSMVTISGFYPCDGSGEGS